MYLIVRVRLTLQGETLTRFNRDDLKIYLFMNLKTIGLHIQKLTQSHLSLLSVKWTFYEQLAAY